MPVVTRRHTVTDPFWASRTKALITSWIPHCIAEINRTDIPPGRGDGGIDNFVEAAKALRGEPHAAHKGYVFSNAWVHQTVESICLALMVDPQGDKDIEAAQARMRATLEDWIPKILAAQHPDGYLQTAFTLRDMSPQGGLPAAGRGDGGLDNFVEAAKALRGEPHAAHKGYVFSNAWVHQTVESICLALMIDPQGDEEIAVAQKKLRATLEDWIPKILAAQHPDGYLQTAFTLRDMAPASGIPAAGRGPWTARWSPAARGNHEGYVAGYFIESAINHYVMTGGKDLRLYEAAKKLADCWADHIGPAPRQEWFDGHQEMEQALVRFGRFVNEVEKKPGQKVGPGDRYIGLAKFLLDCRKDGTEYDQSHVPVQRQYEAVGHAVRAVYTYSGMADVAVETHDVDYQSAVKSLWDNIVHKKYYVTGGVGSGETSEGFGPDYSLRNNAYCEACSTCGEIFFQWKLHLAYHDARYADLYEQSLYNALYGSMDLAAKNFYYDNPLDANRQRYPWHNCPCCVGNIARTMLMLPTWTYSRGADGVYVNLFVGGRVNLGEVAGTEVEMVQETRYPWEGRVRLTVNPETPARFAVRIRVPKRDVSTLYRAEPNADGIGRVAVNGVGVKAAESSGYVEIARLWKKGDTIDITLPMPVQRVYGSGKITAGNDRPSPTRDRVALRVGPLVYNIEQVDQDITEVLPPSAPLAAEWRADLLNGVTVVKGTFASGKPMLAIPNVARYNRNPPPAAGWPPPAPPAPPAVPGAAPAERPALPPATSIVWIREK
jgi:DUF1680 family protein